MTDTPSATSAAALIRLTDRSLIEIAGPDAGTFLHNLVTANILSLPDGGATYAALLSPQGKILSDFIVLRSGETYRLDVATEQAAALVKRFSLYRLRAAVTIDDRSTHWGVAVSLAPDAPDALPAHATAYADPRHAGLGWRVIAPVSSLPSADPETLAAYEQHRIRHAIPLAGRDFALGDVVPHDINLDDLGAVDFRKGCYIGQEIVSRMKHRGTARRRLVRIHAADAGQPLPQTGTEIRTNGRGIGTIGSVDGTLGLASLRLDWAGEAIASGTPILAGETVLGVQLPDYARFDWPKPAE